ncbi:uncharacterized protein LOC129573278, partial [Sitodiplosis mosellana]|uniref:uncharacterized protein LOC129573278 n=1 Tax=Sitodiplosis mosellana TaxID=263140 RepID=UPI0024440613
MVNLDQLKKKHAFHEKAVKTIRDQINDKAMFDGWSKGDLNERISKLHDLDCQLNDIHLSMVCENAEDDDMLLFGEDSSTLIMGLKAKLKDRIDAINKQDAPAPVASEPRSVQVEVQTTDACGNIPNTWGTFDGDYDSWNSFRDRWLPLHNNKKIAATIKFTNLKTACIGKAQSTLGEWDLTDDDYYKAWNRLQSIFEDDYMQLQSFMQKCFKLPYMRASSSQSIRNVIDTVQKHIHGVKRFVKTDDAHPYVVFAVIDRMDTETYRAWEKFRPSLTGSQPNEPNAGVSEANDANVQANQYKTGKRIPTWKELEQFLEAEVAIRVHAVKRALTTKENASSSKRAKRSERNFGSNKNELPDFLQCVLCDDTHPIYKCENFISMSLAGRKNHAVQHNLCERCLRKNHNGPCVKKTCNQECPRCKSAVRYHNSLLCPHFEIKARTALLTQDKSRGTKRKNQSKRDFNAKRVRNDNYRTDERQLGSSVNKVGDWTLVAKQSNAIKQINTKGTGKCEYTVVLATVNMRMRTKFNNPVICRAIADIGAMLPCVDKQYVEDNGLRTTKCQKIILGVSGPEIIKRKIEAIIQPWFKSDVELHKDFFLLNSLAGVYPQALIDASKDQIEHLLLADEEFDQPKPIDALLSADIYAEIVGDDLYRHKNGAIMQSSSFGHIILGKFKVKNSNVCDLPALNIVMNKNTECDNIEELISKFWEIEAINSNENKALLNKEQKAVEELFVNTHFRDKSGRYVVRIPIKPGCKGLGESRGLALKQFYSLERKLGKNAELKKKYVDYIEEFLRLGYMRLAGECRDRRFLYYIPHHAVEKKFRVVVNASAKTKSGESLNSIQMAGAKLQFDAQLQIMRFRRFKVGVSTDVAKMFNKVGLHQDQWDLQRILWRKSPNEDLKEYVITVVMFGLKSSAYNAVRALNQCAMDQKSRFPQASEAILKCFYMDDGMFSVDSVEEAKLLCKEVEFVLLQGGFDLKGWTSNSKAVESYMNADGINMKIMGEDDESKILGLCWLKASDELAVFVRPIESHCKMTKRRVLSEIARLHDPNGFVAPIVVKAKMLMKEIWKIGRGDGKHSKLKWDDVVPENIKNEWLQYRSDLSLLSNFKVKRWLKLSSKSQLQVHAFCDACDDAYGGSIYTRVVDENGQIHTSLLSSKSRIAPLDKSTTPRLELLAAVTISEHLEAVLEACEFQNADVTVWSDSMVVLHWIAKNPDELKAFVSNRVKLIQSKTKRYKWKHVSSTDNPADLVSRGMKMQEFLKSDLWLEGPSWLKLDESKWPKPKLEVSPKHHDEITKECKAKVYAVQTADMTAGVERETVYNKFEDWDKIINVTAYALRVIRRMKKEVDNLSGRYLSADERNKAIEFWIKFAQNKAYKKEIECIKSSDKLTSKCSIISLRPILDKNGILRVGGRIDKANVAYDKKHQFIVPPKSRLSYLIIHHAHGITMHGGAQLMMQYIRKAFWIPKLRAEIKRYVSSCKECVVQAQEMAQQIMAELPEVRIKPAPPFQNVGVDMAGPFSMRITDKVNMNTRARQLPE